MRPMVAYGRGEVEQAIGYAQTADQLFSAASDNDFADCLDCFAWLVFAEVFLGMYDEALRHAERLVAITRATGQTFILGYMLAGQSRVLAQLGRLKEAAAVADEAAAVGRDLGSQEVLAYGLIQQCLTASWMGDHERAVRAGTRPSPTTPARASGGRTWRTSPAPSRWSTRRLEEGATALIAACGTGDQGLDFGTLGSCAEALACVRAAQDDADAANWADIAEAIANPALTGDVGLARLTRAHALRAADLAASAAAAAGGRPAHQGRAAAEAGRAELAAGLAHAAACDRTAARERPRAAAEIFESCG